MEQPTLETKRLVLRPCSLGDADYIQMYAGDYDVAYNTTSIPHPYVDGMAEDFIKTHKPSFESKQEVVFAIHSKQEGHLVGCIGLILRLDHDAAEVGYWVGKPYWGQGICTEAARKVLHYGFDHLQLNVINAGAYARNPASGRVLSKLGMKHEGTLRQCVKKWGEYLDLESYSILCCEYTKGQT